MEILNIVRSGQKSNEELLDIARTSKIMSNYQIPGWGDRRTLLLNIPDSAIMRTAGIKLVQDKTATAIKASVSSFLGVDGNNQIVIKSMKTSSAPSFTNIPVSVCYKDTDSLISALSNLTELSGYVGIPRAAETVLYAQAVDVIKKLDVRLASYGLRMYVVDQTKAPSLSPGIQNGRVSSATSKGSFGGALIFYVAPINSVAVRLSLPWSNIVRDAIAMEFAYSKQTSTTFSLDRFSKYIAHVANESGGTSNVCRMELRLFGDYTKTDGIVTGIKSIRVPKSGDKPGNFLESTTSVGVSQNIPYDTEPILALIVKTLLETKFDLSGIGIFDSRKLATGDDAIFQFLAGLANPRTAGLFNYGLFITDYNKRTSTKGSYWAGYAGYKDTPAELRSLINSTSFFTSMSDIISHKYIPIWFSKAGYQLQVVRSILGLS